MVINLKVNGKIIKTKDMEYYIFLMVINMKVNGKIDRGPYSKRYIIDLSRAAAKKLGIISAGFCQVEITPFHPEVVPYRAEEDSLPEVPELNLQYTPVATYPDPVWQRDSTDTE